ncbi:MAG: inverse autotransporter beta domain-containing protein [Rhizobiaceae bacterium]
MQAQATESPPKWTGYIDVLGFPGADGTVQRTDLFAPLLQNPNTLSYLNLRSNVDEEGFLGFSAGFGLRHRADDWIIGAYGFYDNHESPDGNEYEQRSFGVEILQEHWDLRFNAYLPEDDVATDGRNARIEAVRLDDQLFVEINNVQQEKAMKGFDVEFGGRLASTDNLFSGHQNSLFKGSADLWGHIGGYNYPDDDEFDGLLGVTGRLEVGFNDLAFAGAGSRLSLGVQGRHDEENGTDVSARMQLRLPLGIPVGLTPDAGIVALADASTLDQLDRRMVTPVVRQHVTVAERTVPTELAPALNLDGVQYDEVVDVYSADELAAYLEDPDTTRLIYFHGDPDLAEERGDEEGPYIDMVHMHDTGAFTLPENFTLASTGFDVPFRFNSRYLGDGLSSWREEGARVGFHGAIAMEAGTHLVGLVIDGTDIDNYPIHIVGTGNRYLNHVIAHRPLFAEENGKHNLYIQQGATVYADNYISWNSAWAGIRIEGGSSLYLTSSQVWDSRYHGIFVAKASYLNMYNVLSTGNSFGLSASGGVNPTDAARIDGNRFFSIDNRKSGIILWGAYLDLTNSVLAENTQHGITVEAINGFADEPPNPGKVKINDGPVEIVLTNVEIYGNDGYGILSKGATIYAVDVTFEKNGLSNRQGDYLFQEGIVRQYTPANYYCTYVGNTFFLNGEEVEVGTVTSNGLDPDICYLPEDERVF